MDLPAAARNGSHHQPKLSAWGEGAGGVGSISNGQEQHGRVASSQCKIAAAHNAQMGEMHRGTCLSSSGVWASNSPAPAKKEQETNKLRALIRSV